MYTEKLRKKPTQAFKFFYVQVYTWRRHKKQKNVTCSCRWQATAPRRPIYPVKSERNNVTRYNSSYLSRYSPPKKESCKWNMSTGPPTSTEHESIYLNNFHIAPTPAQQKRI